MPKVVTGASTNLHFSITCESCGHQYETGMVLEVGKSLLDEMNPKFDIRKKLQNKYDRMLGGDFSETQAWFKCPECEYTQSWNVAGARLVQADKVGNIVGAVPALIVAGLVFKSMTGYGFNIGMLLGPIILGSIIFVVFAWVGRKLSHSLFFRNYNPNKDRAGGGSFLPQISLQ
ncbi:MAG: hypothetical protein JXA25_17245 [Anaerolineales bacterium]|nr:hypothetical protein [Anaerolineales bacterium]